MIELTTVPVCTLQQVGHQHMGLSCTYVIERNMEVSSKESKWKAYIARVI